MLGDGVKKLLRDRLGAGVRSVLRGSPERPFHERAGPFDGIAGPGSAMWLVHGDISTIVGGLRALLVQALHPLVLAGVADYSDYRQDTLGRLHRTVSFLDDVIFGNKVEAVAAFEAVKQIHKSVKGVAPDGRSYNASDSHLLSWVHCTLVDSFWQSRIRYGATPLTAETADRYVAEMAEVGYSLGVENPPDNAAELSARLTAFIPELEVNHQTREIVRFLLWPKLPAASRIPYEVFLAAAIGLLPGFTQRMLGLRISQPVESMLVYPTAVIFLRTIAWALGPHPEIAAYESCL